MAEEYVNKESLAKHIDSRFGEISTPFVVREIRGFPTADVAPKSEVEQLQHKYDLAVAEREANVKGFAEELSKAKSEVAIEVIDEAIRAVYSKIDLKIYSTIGGKPLGDGVAFGKQQAMYDVITLLAELKKKYTEGKE